MIERQQYSGLSVQEFCEQEYLNPATFYYWRKRLQGNEEEETSSLVPVCLDRAHASGMEGRSLELTYPNGVRISLPGNSSLSLIRSLIFLE